MEMVMNQAKYQHNRKRLFWILTFVLTSFILSAAVVFKTVLAIIAATTLSSGICLMLLNKYAPEGQ
jgi:hypothetical protein